MAWVVVMGWSKWARWGLAGLALAGAAGAAALAAQDARLTRLLQPAEPAAAVPPDRPDQPVRAAIVAAAPAEDRSIHTGIVRPRFEADLAFRVSGKITARLVDTGDRVTAGQVLARLDATDYALDLAATVAERGAALADRDRAAAELVRVQGLFAQGHVAQAALDRATSTLAEAESRLDRAGRAQDQAANRAAYADLVATADGVVTAAAADAGQVVAAGQTVLTVAETGALEAEIALPEHQRALVEKASASATLWDADDYPYALRLREIAPDVTPGSRTYRVRLSILSPDAAIALGRTLSVTLTTRARTPGLLVPLAAVMNDGTGAAVWKLSPGGDSVARVPVSLLALGNRTAEVTGALVPGDRVVSLGVMKIDPGRPVRVVETDPSPGS